MNDTLRVHDDLNLVVVDAVKKFRLNDFKPLVDERRAVDGNFFAHVPRRVREDFFNRDVQKFAASFSSEGAARRREQKFFNRFKIFALQALKKSSVLRIDGQNFHAASLRKFGDEFARHNQSFLVGQRDIFSRVDGFNCRFQARKAAHGSQNDFHAVEGRRVDESLTAAREFNARKFFRRKFFVSSLVRQNRQLRTKLFHLPREKFDVGVGR